ncbi:hypothetical protein CAPTEDRAFT_191292 [Capitella teleta]|uniref:Spondin-like TSP1 domain-containing protein n=1 Tax=Capitella teleta TaxID=283909 RepID=R7UDK0_CAPTE|nr:hypothetical protein CAPTEDRAFT_191292 [Capitella teleta]|eukprot:ELU01868.1 hypothetical protein CAPTEDRAFT_191292 [Capitella teleta]
MSREIWCVGSNGVNATDVKYCPASSEPISSMPCFRVCEHHRDQYMWKIDDWSPCLPHRGRQPCEEDAGIQRRNASCVSKCGSISSYEMVCEHFHKRPITERPCRQSCRRDCVTTASYGPWTECNSCWVKNRARFKLVVSAPENDGANCNRLFETMMCPRREECEDHRHTNFQYKVGNWTECMEFQGKNMRKARRYIDILGHRRRVVDCIDIKGTLVDKKVGQK